ncbi:MAG: hypothetical protein OIF58_14185, partial [Cohaesibacter sp.]|nr:hypothetical protein [Cohaesibacter sp.]
MKTKTHQENRGKSGLLNLFAWTPASRSSPRSLCERGWWEVFDRIGFNCEIEFENSSSITNFQ